MSRIAFLHPDLGIGGAERLVIDAALELRERGHQVVVFTTHYDPDRCFEDTKTELLDIRVANSVVPSHIRSRFRAPCSMVRTAFAAMIMGTKGPFDLVFCDLVPHVIPVIRSVLKSKIICYCHYPDKLLVWEGGRGYRLYRTTIDLLEELGLRKADLILVNSAYTAGVFRNTFPRLRSAPVAVVHPGVDPSGFAATKQVVDPEASGNSVILSLNRFARDKNLGLALEAMGNLRERISREEFVGLKLVLAGGYDGRISECRQVVRFLEERTQELNLRDHVTFLFSVSDERRRELLRECLCLVYTSWNEHFGIGILEAMVSEKPVIAVNRGGPLEIVEHGVTGFLCDPEPTAFGDALMQLVENAEERQRMGIQGAKRAESHFSRRAFGDRLDRMVSMLVGGSGT